MQRSCILELATKILCSVSSTGSKYVSLLYSETFQPFDKLRINWESCPKNGDTISLGYRRLL